MQEIKNVKTLTNDEIKELFLELSKHLAYASEIVNKINANRQLEVSANYNWDVPHILAANIDVDSNTGKASPRVHSADAIAEVGFDFEWVDRNCEVFSFQKETNVCGVKVYELCVRKPSEE